MEARKSISVKPRRRFFMVTEGHQAKSEVKKNLCAPEANQRIDAVIF
jgi:hypothetical protein